MSLIDLIEMLGAAVDDRLITLDEATQRVVEFSEGGLTLRGARDSLRRHRRIRADHARIASDAHAMLTAVTAVRDASTPEEEAQARLALDIEATLQRAAGRERLKRRLMSGELPYPPNGDQQ